MNMDEKFRELNDYNEPEKVDSERRTRHRSSVEREVTAEAADRNRFLAEAVNVDDDIFVSIEDSSAKRELYGMTNDWVMKYPEHAKTIETLQNSSGLVELVRKVVKEGGNEQLDDVSSFFKKLLREQKKDWPRLSEREKREVRVAEIGLLLCNVVRINSNIDRGNIDRKRLGNVENILKKYSVGVDIPDDLRTKIFEPTLQKIGRALGTLPPPIPDAYIPPTTTPSYEVPRYMPWEDAPGLGSLFGNKPPRRPLGPDNKNAPKKARVPPQTKPGPVAVVRPPGLPSPATPAVKPPDEGIIDMKYNPASGSFEAGGGLDGAGVGGAVGGGEG